MEEKVDPFAPILLVRHAQAECNVDSNIGGWQNPGLTALGRSQAKSTGKQLVKELKDKEFTVYSSPLRRAYETTKIICKELESIPVFIDELKEYQTGLPPTMNWAEAEKKWNRLHKPLKNQRICSGAETFGDLYKRAGEVLSYIMEEETNHAIIVSHAWILDKMIAWWIGFPLSEINVKMFGISNASISELSLTGFGEHMLKRLNDRAHLLESNINHPVNLQDLE